MQTNDSLAHFKLQYEKYSENKENTTKVKQHNRTLWVKSFDTLTDLSLHLRKLYRVGYMASRAGVRKVK